MNVLELADNELRRAFILAEEHIILEDYENQVDYSIAIGAISLLVLHNRFGYFTDLDLECEIEDMDEEVYNIAAILSAKYLNYITETYDNNINQD